MATDVTLASLKPPTLASPIDQHQESRIDADFIAQINGDIATLFTLNNMNYGEMINNLASPSPAELAQPFVQRRDEEAKARELAEDQARSRAVQTSQSKITNLEQLTSFEQYMHSRTQNSYPSFTQMSQFFSHVSDGSGDSTQESNHELTHNHMQSR